LRVVFCLPWQTSKQESCLPWQTSKQESCLPWQTSKQESCLPWQTSKQESCHAKTCAIIASALIFGLQAAFGSTLVLYPKFAEVRDQVSVAGPTFSWVPEESLAAQLVPGSVELLDPNVTAMQRLDATQELLSNFEGRQVQVYSDTERRFVSAKVVRASMALFEIDGALVQISNPSVRYPDMRGIRFTDEYSWQLATAKAAHTATLRYITRGLSWENTRYSLDLMDDKNATLQAWAQVRNLQKTAYSAPALTLFAGQFDLPANDGEANSAALDLSVRNQLLSQRNAVTVNSAAGGYAQGSQAREGSGVQHYQYAHPVHFAAHTTTALPLLKSNVTVKSLLEYQGTFSVEPREITALQRVYAFTATAGLPAGGVSVRADGSLIGYAAIDTTAQQGNVRVQLGRDVDVQITRSVTVLLNTRALRRYRVRFEIKNVKTRPINVRIAEFLPGDATIENVELPDNTLETGGLVSRPVIAAGATFIGSYDVAFINEDA
jgi:hypothetical protein